MKIGRDLLVSLLFTLLVWGCFAWPLPRYVSRAIPSSAENIETPGVRRMIPGDHLQLLYNYWLVADMTAGRTPWAANPYEFNAGADVPLKRDAWGNLLDQPFTGLFALGYRFVGRAAAWNITGFISLWITFLATWMLLRRFLPDARLAFFAAAPSILLSFRWANLLGGSPMGFAMMWVPLLFWGMHVALFSRRWIGPVVAATAIICMRWSDTHVFFFCLLALPAWMLFLALWDWPHTRSALRAGRATLPRLTLPAATALLLAIGGHIQKSTHLAETTIGAGRSWREIALYSPRLTGLWSGAARGVDVQIFIGYGLLTLGLLAGVTAVVIMFRDRHRRVMALAAVGLLAGLVVLILLALGVNGPLEALPLRLAQKWIPPYSMVRQPAKILCLLPTLLAVLAALYFSLTRRSRLGMAAGLALLLAGAVESKLNVRPTLCLLDTQQGAYQAAAERAAQMGHPPHALIVPLWPGDSAWTSLYEHYASLYRIRMLNGYTPIVPHEYLRDVFDRFQSANSGHLDDAQLDELLRRGVQFLILHEDAFPEKVSYFPVAFTLKQFLNHPRLEFLTQDRAAWSFRIRPEAVPPSPPAVPNWTVFFPTAVREMEWSAMTPEQRRESPDAQGGAYVTLTAEHPVQSLPPFEYLPVPQAGFLVRVRGPGVMHGTLTGTTGELQRSTVETGGSDWNWQVLPVTHLPPTPALTPTFTYGSGTVDLDALLYLAGSWTAASWQPGETRRLPAPLFFHAGYTDLPSGSVRLDPEREPRGIVFYGLRLPFQTGRYRFALRFESPAPSGARLGAWTASADGHPLHSAVPLIADKPAEAVLDIKDTRLVEFHLDYDRTHPLALHELSITRLDAESAPPGTAE